ncbi:Uu.00g103820.m01.CDS01 [Anthostomella pinea]|uniref:Uu.00g103820.m01.CDS01 n=1 Tax=Anthostomella pinea TaxID=933095 RepID=A0AAI8VDP2_9PEZI|nr:Uu.00g103820.m01.CDS01 [Anthostomella pinea]
MAAKPTALARDVRTYKEETGYVVKWVVSTSRAYGFERRCKTVRKDEGSTSPQEQPRTATTPAPASACGIITCKQLVRRAKFLSNVAKQLPSSVMRALEQSIRLRESVGSLIQALGLPDSLISDTKHRRFISTLESLRRILSPLLVSAKEDVSTIPPGRPSFAKLTRNTFESLQFCDCRELEDDHEVFQPQNDKDSAEGSMKAEIVELDLYDAFAAFIELIEELKVSWDIIMRAWAGYQDRVLDLAAVSLTTNTAIDLIRTLEARSAELIEQHGGPMTMVSAYGRLVKSQHGYVDKADQYTAGEPHFFESNCELISCLLEVGITLFDTPIGKAEKKKAYASAERRREVLEEFDMKAMTQERDVDCSLFRMFLCNRDSSMVRPQIGETESVLSPLDEFAVHHVLVSRQIPMWSIFAATVLHRLHKWSDEEIERPWNDLVALTKEARKPENISSTGGRFELFRSNPILCGTWLWCLRHEQHRQGILLIDLSSIVVPAAHLYNALRTEKLLHTSWKDMELMLLQQGKDKVFHGGQPPDRRDRFKQMLRPWRREWHLGGIENILRSGKWNVELPPDDEPSSAAPTSPQAPCAEDGLSLSRRAKCLQKLLGVLNAETWEMSFSYFDFHLSCRTLLQRSTNATEKLILSSALEESFEPQKIYLNNMQLIAGVYHQYMDSGLGSVLATELTLNRSIVPRLACFEDALKKLRQQDMEDRFVRVRVQGGSCEMFLERGKSDARSSAQSDSVT